MRVVVAIALLAACGNDPAPAPSPPPPKPSPPPIDAAPTARDRLLDENRELVRIATEKFPIGSWPVDGNGHAQPDSCHRTSYKYTLARTADGLHVQLTLGATAPGSTPERAAELLASVRACTARFRAKWAAYGLPIDVAIDLVAADKSRDDIDVVLVDAEGRSVADTYYISNSGWGVCPTLVHEWGHLLGLPDEYGESGTCRDAPATPSDPANIMAVPFVDAEFYPRHIRLVLEQAWPVVELIRRKPGKGTFQRGKHIAEYSDDLRKPSCHVSSTPPDQPTYRLFAQMPYNGSSSDYSIFTDEHMYMMCRDATTAAEIAAIMGDEIFDVRDPGPLFDE